MDFIERIYNLNQIKFSFGKNNEFIDSFNKEIGALSMNIPKYGLEITSNLTLKNQLLGVFMEVIRLEGIFLFNIAADLIKAKKGFINFEEAYDTNKITEWELSIILQNKDYLSITKFHNGRVELILTQTGIKVKMN